MSAYAHPAAEEIMSAASSESVRVNIGCGIDAPEGWCNLDNSPTIWMSRVPLARRMLGLPAWPRNVRQHDVLKGLPFADASVDFIYSSHTFEHFTYAESLAVTKECFRALKPRGVLRVAVPDLGRMVRDYLADSKPMASHSFVDRLLLQHTWQDWLHRGAHHCQMFDARSLAALFREAGFADPQVSQFGESRIPEVLQVELGSRKRESLYVEAEKRGVLAGVTMEERRG